MKHSSSSTHFSGIDTNTLAGQWMTFSHMANHYRKLLNVKPRVDTGLVQGNGVQTNFTTSSALMMQSSKSKKKMGSSNKRQTLSSNSNSSTNNFQLYQQQNKKNSLLFSSHPDHLNMPRKAKEMTSKSTLKSSSKHSPSCQLQPQPRFSDYQVVFGPSSIRSSTDAFLSDETDSTMSNEYKPPSEVQTLIGVSEKIRRFLSHIHQPDLPSPSSAKELQRQPQKKDSSRDSAYGFSSGESRITTRESTPEKKCLGEKSHKQYRSYRDIDLQERPCKDRCDKEVGSSLSNGKRFSSKALKDHRHLRSSRKDGSPIGSNVKTNVAQSLHRQDSSERYITLLAELTQDIVNQGIYTNKGLKTVFKSYMDQHKNLNQDKLADMLERLRMDLGIPKDDALDRIEFGYGSISNKTSTTFFYKPPSPDEKLSPEPIPDMNAPTYARSTESLQSDSPSPTTIIPTAIIPEAVTPAPTTTTGFSSAPNTSSNRSTTTTEEGSGDMASDNDNYKNHKEDIGIGIEDDDELSLSETEVTLALKFAGLDAGEMEELVGILNS